jgi:hypothetical protein
MKMFAFILSFIILFLSVEPGIQIMVSHSDTEQGCCGGIKDSHEMEETESGCCQSTCNPFFKCSSCTIVFMNVAYYFPERIQSFTKTEIPYQFISTTPFPSEFWQPPKQV